jgi:hypothetical protein
MLVPSRVVTVVWVVAAHGLDAPADRQSEDYW